MSLSTDFDGFKAKFMDHEKKAATKEQIRKILGKFEDYASH